MLLLIVVKNENHFIDSTKGQIHQSDVMVCVRLRVDAP